MVPPGVDRTPPASAAPSAHPGRNRSVKLSANEDDVEAVTVQHTFRGRPRQATPPESLPGAGAPVVLVAGHLLFGQCMAEALVGAGFTVTLGLFHEEAAALRAVEEHDRPLVVLDLDTAEGADVARLVGALRLLGGRVVVLTSPATQLVAAECVAAGAESAVDKRAPIAPLVRTLLEVARPAERGRRAPGEAVVGELLRVREEERRRLRPFETLTAAEKDVLAALLDGLKTAEIADLRVVSTETVRSQVKAILSKLGVGSQLGAVALARSAGWTPTRPTR